MPIKKNDTIINQNKRIFKDKKISNPHGTIKRSEEKINNIDFIVNDGINISKIIIWEWSNFYFVF